MLSHRNGLTEGTARHGPARSPPGGIDPAPPARSSGGEGAVPGPEPEPEPRRGRPGGDAGDASDAGGGRGRQGCCRGAAPTCCCRPRHSPSVA